jgi:hypothetical protein
MKTPLNQIKLAGLTLATGFALAAHGFAVTPPPGGGYPIDNTALGDDALFSQVTDSGGGNTGLGFNALYHNTFGAANTGVGSLALFANTGGNRNTGLGYGALANADTSDNTAVGWGACGGNSTGTHNVGVGGATLQFNGLGNENTALGFAALSDLMSGGNNIAIGAYAGQGVSQGSNNIEIGNFGKTKDSGVTRIGSSVSKQVFITGIINATVAGGVGVVVSPSGQLGVITSSARYKEAIKPMDKASEVLLQLQPVTFRYKKELDSLGIPQFGLVAEQVAKVDPDLVARDESGKPYTVRYEAVNAMLLNEFLKEHKTVESLQSTVAEQREEIAQLGAGLKAQAAQIQQVSAAVAAAKAEPRIVANE